MITIVGVPGRDPAGVWPTFSSFYFDTALSASPAALPSLLAFADASHITFGSDFPFALLPARKYFADNLDNYDGLYEASSTQSTAPSAVTVSAAGTKWLTKVICPHPYRVAAGGWRRPGIRR